MKTTIAWASLLVGLALYLSACSEAPSPKKQLGLVEPPIAELAPAYQQFTINTQEESTLTLPSGTVLTVPANALVDANGELVKGEATIKYREYHDAASVVLSGIPMDYRSNGEKQHFQTAGMFDIAGEQNGAALAIKKGSGIQVDLASYEEGTDYNLFALNQEQGWQFVNYVAPTPNQKRETMAQELEKLQRKTGTGLSPYFVFTYDGILDVNFQNNPLSAKNKANSKVKRKFEAYGVDAYKSSVYRYLKYDNRTYPADMIVWKNVGKTFPRWARSQRCGIDLQLLQNKTYKAIVTSGAKKFEGKITMILPIKDLFDYSPEQWKNDKASILKDMEAKAEKYRLEMERLRLEMEQQAAVIRSFKIAGFGIYNYDRLMKEEDRIEILANFETKEDNNLNLVLCLPEDGKTVIKYPKQDWNKVNLLPNNKARFLSILPNKKVILYSAKAYQALAFDNLRKQEKPTVDFELTTVIEELNSEEALRELLDS